MTPVGGARERLPIDGLCDVGLPSARKGGRDLEWFATRGAITIHAAAACAILGRKDFDL